MSVIIQNLQMKLTRQEDKLACKVLAAALHNQKRFESMMRQKNVKALIKKGALKYQHTDEEWD